MEWKNSISVFESTTHQLGKYGFNRVERSVLSVVCTQRFFELLKRPNMSIKLNGSRHTYTTTESRARAHQKRHSDKQLSDVEYDQVGISIKSGYRKQTQTLIIEME